VALESEACVILILNALGFTSDFWWQQRKLGPSRFSVEPYCDHFSYVWEIPGVYSLELTASQKTQSNLCQQGAACLSTLLGNLVRQDIRIICAWLRFQRVQVVLCTQTKSTGRSDLSEALYAH